MSQLDKMQVLATEYEMFLKRSSVYIGVTEPKTASRLVLPPGAGKFSIRDVTLIPSFIKVCDEAIVNASDAMQNLFRLGKKASSGQIEFEFDPAEDRITIKNYAPHSIEIREDVIDDRGTKRWLPQTVFTKLHVSSNFTEEGEEKNNHKGGVNGVGSKAITYTSSLFELEVAHSGVLYQQTFKNRGEKLCGGDASTPVIGKTKSPDYVSVSFIPDTRSFKTNGKKLLDKDSLSFLRKRCYDVALMNPGIKIFLDGTQISVTQEQYFSMCGFDTKNYLSYEKEFVRNKVKNSVKVFVFDSPGFGEANYQLLLNGLFVGQSSLHGNFVSEFAKFLGTATKRNLSTKQNISLVKGNLSIFCVAQINNIDFTGQTKDNFEYGKFTYGFDFEKDIEVIKKLRVWKVCTALKQEDDFEILEKNATRKPIGLIEKYEDCDLANRKRRKGEVATLIVVEGDSAKSCVMAGLSKEQRKTHGVYPFRGKPLNVLCCDNEKLSLNNEFNDLRTILGLKVISDPKQNATENAIGKLRYDRMVILSDQDHDGAHIRGLTVNIFGKFWPHLLEQGFLCVIRTPIVNIYAQGEKTITGPSGKTVKVKSSITLKSCYTIKEFNEWEEFVSSTPGTKITVVPTGCEKAITISKSAIGDPKYIKGLGTLDKCNAVEVFELYNDYKLVADDNSSNNINLVFSRERAGDRKAWIKFGEEDEVLDTKAKEVSVSDLLDTEVRAFSRYNTGRALPDYVDGFKTSNRKIAWVLYNDKFIGSPCSRPKNNIKVAQLGGAVSKDTAYHHGEASLFGTIIGMAQNFIGSNNLGPLLPLGQYGTRISGKAGAAQPRYIFTALNAIMKLIFRKEDVAVTTLLKDDGVVIEPDRMIPIIPFILINGTTGIGSGYSCNIPKHHPVEVVDQMIDRVNGYETEDLLPWFKYSQCEYQVVRKCDESLNSTMEDYVHPRIYQFAEFEVFPEESKIVVTDLPVRYLFEETKQYYQSISKEFIDTIATTKKKGRGKVAEAEAEATANAAENAILLRFDMTYTDNSCKIVLYLKDEWTSALVELKKRKNLEEEPPGLEEDFSEDSTLLEEDTQGAKEGEYTHQDILYNVPSLLSKLRLVDTQNLAFSNAHAISEYGDIVKLKGTADVVERFYNYRFKKYRERKAAVLAKMEYDISYKQNVANFVRAIKEEKLNVAKANEDEVVDYLEANKFTRFHNGAEKEEDEASKRSAGYSYLLSIPVRNITKERAEKLEREIAALIISRDEYKAKKIAEIWLGELAELRTALLEYSEPVDNEADIRFPFYKK